jgi:hypothetical protein
MCCRTVKNQRIRQQTKSATHSGVGERQETTCYCLIRYTSHLNEKSDIVAESSISINTTSHSLCEEGRKKGEEICQRNHRPHQHHNKPILLTSASWWVVNTMDDT